ncbi:hypothetical protein [Cellulomonas terrae]|uniref:hypothetical protein n=1 Tax=Cellulomonas terrae TaxID=311234 RepID=UPI0011BD51C2|nr:hypothetical protein [Cellulomonas terrae]
MTLEDCRESARGIAGTGVVHPALHRHLQRNPDVASRLAAGLTPLQLVRFEAEPDRGGLGAPSLIWHHRELAVDLRVLVDASARIGVARPYDAVAHVVFSPHSLRPTDPALAWPLFVERPDRLDDALGLAVPEVTPTPHELTIALGILEQMPVLPSRYLPLVSRVAVDGAARPRAAARQVIERHGNPVRVATGGLAHGRAGVRASAASWLQQLDAVQSLPDVRRAAAEERSAAARASMRAVIDQLSRRTASSRPR